MLFCPCFLFLALLVSLFYLNWFITTSFIFFFPHRGRMPFSVKSLRQALSPLLLAGAFPPAPLILDSRTGSTLLPSCVFGLPLYSGSTSSKQTVMSYVQPFSGVCMCSHIHGGVLRYWFVSFVSTPFPWNLNLLGPTWSCGHDFRLYTVPFPRRGSLPGQAQSGPLRT